MNIIRRFFLSVWKVLNITRKVILNLIMLVLLLAFIAVSTGTDPIVVPPKAALVLNIVGDIVEQKHDVSPVDTFINEAFEQKEDNPEILLTNIVDVINKAKNDDRISILVLQLQGLKRTGLTKLQDIGFALNDFKKSGKKIIALGDAFSQDQYYLASYADDIWLNPQGYMLLEGYGRYQLYFKSALDKLAINQHIFRVGTYKSAVEPFIRDDMSAAARIANKKWLSDLWLQYKQDVAKQRGFAIDNFDETIDDLLTKFKNSQSSFAQYALDNHWVDQLKTREEMRKELITLVGENKSGNSYSHIGFKDYLTVTTALLSLDDKQESSDKVAIIVAKGTILDGKQAPGTIGGDSTAALLRKARLNDDVKAVVLRVDSPGGSAYASEIIRQEIELIKQAGKPVIASMGTYAASGGYWISAPANKIYAAPSTITGSIGIFGLFMTFEDSLAKLGVHTDGVATTDIAGMGLTQPLSDGMAQLFQLSINQGYQNFIGLVAEHRNMTLAQVDKIAQGRVWSGVQAKELGLVDELGNLLDAVTAAAKLAKLTSYDTLLIEKEKSSRNVLLQKMLGNAKVLFATSTDVAVNDLISGYNSANTPISALMQQVQSEIIKINQFNDPQGRYTLCTACN